MNTEKLVMTYKAYLEAMGYSKEVLRQFPLMVRRFFKYLAERSVLDLGELDGKIVSAYYLYLQTSPQPGGGALSQHSINQYMYGLRLFLDYLHKTGKIRSNPLEFKYYQPCSSTRMSMRPDQIEALYKACKKKVDRALLSVLYGCGLRKSEAVNLVVKDIDLSSGWLYVRKGKGKKRRAVPLSSGVKRDIGLYVEKERSLLLKGKDKGHFLLDSRGNGMSGQTISRRFKRLVMLAKLDIHISVHHLRHSIATHLLAGGLSIEEVRDFLGHGHLETTQIYTH